MRAKDLKEGRTFGDSVYIQWSDFEGYKVTQLNHPDGVKRYYFNTFAEAAKRFRELKRWPNGFNGYNSRDDWNVVLWITNSEPEYRYARDIYQRYFHDLANKAKPNGWSNETVKRKAIIRAANYLYIRDYHGQRTPDGAQYTEERIRLAVESIAD